MKQICWTALSLCLLLAATGVAAQDFRSEEERVAEAYAQRLEGLSTGPDVTVFDLSGIDNYTSGGGTSCPAGYGNGSEDCRGYAFGTESCGVGSYPSDWCDQTSSCRTTTSSWHPIAPASVDDHPVIAQNLYRLKDGRFQQIGASFLKHGFVSTNSSASACMWNDNGTPNSSCVQPPAGGDQLGLGCVDFYWAGLNGSRPLGRRSDVHAAGGEHAANPAGGETNDAYDQRVVVAESDIDPAQNAGAKYWGEGQYVVRDDARANNGLNNASYRPISVGSMPGLNLSFTNSTVRELPAIFAWQEEDPQVEIVFADKDTMYTGEEAKSPVPPGNFYPDYTVTERFNAARRVTEVLSEGGGTTYHYEYAIHNINSHTSADGFLIDFGGPASITNVGFSDIAHHSGEPYDTSDWTPTVDMGAGTVSWDAADAGDDTNALRWGTMYSFWFDSDVAPDSATHTLKTFRDSGTLDVPFGGTTPGPDIFEDGFESGDTSAWSSTLP